MKNTARIIAATVAAATLTVLAPGHAEAAKRHVPAKVCAQAYQHPHDATAKQCRRQGWWIDVSWAPVGDTMVKDVLVIGPRGRVYQDTFGQVEFR